MSRRPNIRRLVLQVFRCKGPLTDAELAWWVSDVLQQNPATAKKVRWALARDKKVRFAPRRRRT
jgi:hypothetical protein